MSATGGLGVQSKEQEAERKDKNDRRNQWRTSEPRSGIAGSYGGFIARFFKESLYRLP